MEPHSKLLIFSLSHILKHLLNDRENNISCSSACLQNTNSRHTVAADVQIYLTSSLLHLRLRNRISSFWFQQRFENWRKTNLSFSPKVSFPFLIWKKTAFGSLEWKLAVHLLMAAKSRLPSGWCRCHCFDFIQVVTQQTLLCLII